MRCIDGNNVLAAENEAVTELKNRKVRSGSVGQSMKVLREPIQIAEKAKVKFFSRASRGLDHHYTALCTAFGSGRTTQKLLAMGLHYRAQW